jgi:hypothetical protein
MRTYYLISLLNGLDIQFLPEIHFRDQATETADRLRFFFKSQGLEVDVFLEEIREEIDYSRPEDDQLDIVSRKRIDF